MSKDIKTYEELNKIILDAMYEVIEYVAKRIHSLLISHIDEDVYINQNNYYARGTKMPTYEFRESWDIDEVEKAKDTVQSSIYHNPQKMSFSPEDFVHGSELWHTNDIRELLPLIIEKGLSGNLFGAGWWQEPRPFFANTLEELNNKGLIKKWFKEGMDKYGLSIE